MFCQVRRVVVRHTGKIGTVSTVGGTEGIQSPVGVSYESFTSEEELVLVSEPGALWRLEVKSEGIKVGPGSTGATAANVSNLVTDQSLGMNGLDLCRWCSVLSCEF